MGTSGGPATAGGSPLVDDPQYKAPEQFQGDPVDARVDIFALGVIGHEMLTGRNPFLGGVSGSSSSAAYRIMYLPYPEIEKGTIPGLNEDARLVIKAAMTKDLEARFPDARSFLQALAAVRRSVNMAVPIAATAAGGGWRGFLDSASYQLFEAQRSPAPYVVAALLVIVGLAVAIFVVSERAQDTVASRRPQSFRARPHQPACLQRSPRKPRRPSPTPPRRPRPTPPRPRPWPRSRPCPRSRHQAWPPPRRQRPSFRQE